MSEVENNELLEDNENQELPVEEITEKKSVKEMDYEKDEKEDDEEEMEEKVKKESVSAPRTKSGMISALFDKVNSMKKEEVAKKFGNLMDVMEAEMEVDDIDMGDASADNPHGVIKKTKKKVMVPDINVKEDIDALVQGEELSEDFRSKAATIFEAAVHQKVMEVASQKVEELEEEYKQQLEEEVVQFRDELTDKVDNYLNYVVEEWVKENEIALESALRSEITEEFMGGLRNLFTEHYIEVPEEKVDIVESLFEKVEELEGKLNKSIQENLNIKTELNDYRKNQIVEQICDDLADTQAEKMRSLVEGLSVEEDAEEFANKVKMIKESYFPVQNSNDEVIENQDVTTLTEETESAPVKTSSIMDAYTRAISRK